MSDTRTEAFKLAYGYLDDAVLAEACMLDKNIAEKVCSDRFWMNKIRDRFGIGKETVDKYGRGNNYAAYYSMLSNLIRDNPRPFDLLDYASDINRLDIVEYIFRNPEKYPLTVKEISPILINPVENGNMEMLEMFVRNGADVKLGGLLLSGAANNNDMRMVKYLISQGKGLRRREFDHINQDVDQNILDILVEKWKQDGEPY